MVRDIEGRGLSGAELQEFLGRAEAVAGFRAIQGNLGTFETAIAGVREAESEGRVFRQIEIVEADPILAASRDARKAAAERQLNEEELGIQEAQAQAAIDRTVTNVRGTRGLPVGRTGGRSSWTSWQVPGGRPGRHRRTRWQRLAIGRRRSAADRSHRDSRTHGHRTAGHANATHSDPRCNRCWQPAPTRTRAAGRTMNTIGPHNFILLRGPVPPITPRLERITRFGTTDVIYRKSAGRVEPFAMVSLRDAATFEAGWDLLDTYKDLIGAGPQAFEHEGTDYDAKGFEVIVVNVAPVSLTGATVVIGGFATNPTAVLRARWTLELRPKP